MTGNRKRIYIIAGEDSGDNLGGSLMAALKRLSPAPLEFAGLGGSSMMAEGITPPFALDEVAVMGAAAILKQLPHLYRRAHDVITDAVAFAPDVIVVIDSPEFTHPIARRLRKRLPGIPIVNYVSPSVWALRSYRAPRMVAYVDEVLALLPFEPQVYRELKGPPCTYVGHPLVEMAPRLLREPSDSAAIGKRVALFPGSRRSEVMRLMPVLGDSVALMAAREPGLGFVIAATEAQAARVAELAASWSVKPDIVQGQDAKERVMRTADIAIAASGTVTLELALARVPMVVIYRIDWIIALFRGFLRAHSVVLANLVAGGNDIPELIHKACTAKNIADHALPLLSDSDERARQNAAFDRVAAAMQFKGPSPSSRAAARVLGYIT